MANDLREALSEIAAHVRKLETDRRDTAADLTMHDYRAKQDLCGEADTLSDIAAMCEATLTANPSEELEVLRDALERIIRLASPNAFRTMGECSDDLVRVTDIARAALHPGGLVVLVGEEQVTGDPLRGQPAGAPTGLSPQAVSGEAAHQAQDKSRAPYGEWCRSPELCAGKGYCPRDPTCGD